MKGTKTLLSYLLFIIGLQWKTVYVDAQECGVNYFKCKKNGKCILGAFRCDGEFDCDDDDKSDEDSCEEKPTAGCQYTSEFQCKNGKCISKSYTCDFVDDCGDNSDESSTDGPLCANTDKCPSGMFKCKKSGKCIYQSYVCDGEVDCGENDDSDEKENCETGQCEANEFKCNDFRCIDKDWVCDGADDCGDNSDEKNCTATVFPTTSTTVASKTEPPKAKLGQIREGINCDKFSFYCPIDNRCIHDKWVCDGFIDCEDNYDEQPKFCNKKCKDSEFTCPDGTCIPESKKCDGEEHCPNGQDEMLPQCDAFVPCGNNTYKCGSNKKCLRQENVCDRIKHCPLGDDEGTECGANECATNNGDCSHHCVDLKIGHRCGCPLGFKLRSNNRTCKDVNECLAAGICSQFCFNKNGSYECQCDEGFELLPDKKTCRVKAPKPYLLFSTGKEIREVSTNFHDYKSVLKKTEDVTCIDADVHDEMIYWVNKKQKTINRAKKYGNRHPEIIVKNESPLSLSLDWIGRKLYWINSESNAISVSNLDGSHVKTFLQGTKDDKFDALDVLPDKRMLYFSNHGEEMKIEKISLDGATDRETVVDKTHAAYSSFLSVDRIMGKLYWVNTETSHVISSKLNGNDINTVIKLNGTNINGLEVFEDYLYITSEKTSHIYKFDKYTGKNVGKISKVSKPSDIIIYHPAAQKKVYHPCQTANGGCSHLCFISNLQQKSIQCDCPDTMKLYTDKKTCIPKVVVDGSKECENGYVCNVTKECIPQRLLCNGVKNCAFNDDELNCVKVKGREHSKRISSKKTILFILLPSVILVLFIVVGTLIYRQCRKKSKQADMTIVFERDNETLNGKNLDDKIDVQVKYMPNTLRNKKKDRNFVNKNYDDTKTPLHTEMETECMVDQDSSDNSSSDICFDESQPIIS